MHTRFTLVIRRHRSTDSVYRHRLPVCTRLHCSGKRKQVSAGIVHASCTYLHCAVCRTLETCTRARATSVTARGAERFRARLVPSRGFLIEPVQKVLSRMQRRARKKRRLQGSSNAARPPCSLQHFLSLFPADNSRRYRMEKAERKELVDYKEIWFDFIIKCNRDSRIDYRWINLLTTINLSTR